MGKPLRLLMLVAATAQAGLVEKPVLYEMTTAGAEWQLVSCGGAVHSFTDKEAGDDPSTGAAYDEKADRRSWQAMKLFFAEIFEA